MRNTFVVSLILIIFTAYVNADEHAEQSIAQKIAQAHGISGFENVKQITFTFNAQLDELSIVNSWMWDVETGLVKYKTNDTAGQWKSYNINEITDEIKEVDAHFINDKYWLLFPFQIVWDSNVSVEVAEENAILPISGETAKKVVVKYGPQGGYTPGDTYEIYVDDSYKILEWVYKRGGSGKPGVMTTWEKHTKFGPFLAATDFHGSHMLGDKKRKLHISLTDIEFKMKAE